MCRLISQQLSATISDLSISISTSIHSIMPGARPEQDIAQGGPWGMSSVQVHLNSQATRRRIYLLVNTLNNK